MTGLIFLIILLAIFVVGVFLFNSYQNKYQSLQGNIFNFFVVISLVFVVLSVGYVYISNEVSIRSLSDITSFFKIYFSWLGSAFSNAQNIAGYAINQDWTVNISAGGKK